MVFAETEDIYVPHYYHFVVVLGEYGVVDDIW
jgi:hypothetical protein